MRDAVVAQLEHGGAELLAQAASDAEVDLCIGCGLCEELCPAVFELGDDGVAHVIDPEECEAAGCCEEAAEECPVDAISLE